MNNCKASIFSTRRNEEDDSLWDVMVIVWALSETGVGNERLLEYTGVDRKLLLKWQRLDAAGELFLVPGKSS